MKKLLLLITIFCCISCGTTKVEYVPVERVTTLYINNIDSIYLHDSIYYEVKTKGDTVFETKYKYKVLEKYQTDTIVKTDSIPVIKNIERIVEVNVLYWWQKLLMYSGILLFVFLLLYIIYKIKK